MKRSGGWVGAAVAVAAAMLYLPLDVISGQMALRGFDYRALHMHRIAFAQEQLRLHGGLPGWYSRELLGTPFSANLQNFPLLPLRWPLLLIDARYGYALAIALAAALSALAAFALARRFGGGLLGSAAAGWTFAAAGDFSSRVLVGHLPLLEAYPALPVLLLLADRAADDTRAKSHSFDLLWLGLCAGAFALAGHPQVPFYALSSAGLFVLLRHPWPTVLRPGPSRRALTALVTGAGLAAVGWVPMGLLTAESTRVLSLDPANNDISFPLGRLLALFAPAIDGWPTSSGVDAFHGYANTAIFWDTACYVGVLPWVALLGLGAWLLKSKQVPQRPLVLIAALGLGALFLAVVMVPSVRELIPGTLLRSPARAVYISTLAIALAFGRAVDALPRVVSSPLLKIALAVAVVAIQLFDLGSFARIFVQSAPLDQYPFSELEQGLTATADSPRTGIDRTLDVTFSHRYDDVGVFDSLLLARPYRALLALSDLDPKTNWQRVDGSQLSPGALAFAGTTRVVTLRQRGDLPPFATSPPLNAYDVPSPEPRAKWVSGAAVEYLSEEEMLSRFHSSKGIGLPPLFLEPAQRQPGLAEPAMVPLRSVRPEPDLWQLELDAPSGGFVALNEAYERGWRATVDGAVTPLLIGSTCLMVIPVTAGHHRVELRYATPGRALGAGLSVLFAGLLLTMCFWPRRASA